MLHSLIPLICLNLGIKVVSSVFSLFMMLLIGAFFFITATPLVRFFVPSDMRLIEYAAVVLSIYAATFAFSGIQLALAGAFRGAGGYFYNNAFNADCHLGHSDATRGIYVSTHSIGRHGPLVVCADRGAA